MALSTETKESRKAFRSSYSSGTANIIQRIARGQSSQQIAKAVGVSVSSVGTTRGNLTRNLYRPFAYVNEGVVQGSCEF